MPQNDTIQENLSINLNSKDNKINKDLSEVMLNQNNMNSEVSSIKCELKQDNILEMKYKTLLAEAEKVSKELMFIRDKGNLLGK